MRSSSTPDPTGDVDPAEARSARVMERVGAARGLVGYAVEVAADLARPLLPLVAVGFAWAWTQTSPDGRRLYVILAAVMVVRNLGVRRG